MDLKHTLAVVARQRFKIALAVTPPFRLRLDLNRHRLTKDRQPFLQNDHPLFMQKHQCPVDRSQRIFQLPAQKQILVDCFEQLFGLKLHQQAC